MGKRPDLFALSALLAVALLPSGAPLAAEFAKQPSPAPEAPDQSPGTKNPRADILARSPGARIGIGSYLSVQVNVDAFAQNIVGDAANEPSIAVNPTNPSNMVIGWRQFDTVTSNFRQAGWAYTFDGGETWTFPGVLQPGVFRSDPVLDADSQGTFYYQSLTGSFTLDVFRSTNGGASWLSPVPEFGGDKNWMAVDRGSGPGAGNVYGIWQRFFACCGFNVLTRSTNGGASYESPVPVAFSPTFGTLAVGPSSELYAAGIDGTVDQDLDHFVVSQSTDAWNPLLTPTFSGGRVELGGSMGFGGAPNPGGLLGQANVAVDRSPGPAAGYVYLLASVVPGTGDPMDLHFARSADGGATWSQPVRVNDDASSANWQWFGAHSVSPTGRIDAIWYDTRNSGSATVSQIFYAFSYDAGASWSPNVPVSPSFDSTLGWPQQSKIGDYMTLVSDATGADVAYAATFNGEQDVYYVRVFPDCNGNGVSDVTDVAGGASQDCDADHVPDECQVAPLCSGAGVVPDGRLVPGAPLAVEKAPGNQIRLRWGASCQVDDTDYAVYEGILGDFTSHAARFCTTGGLRVKAFAPAHDSAYYLVVPTHGVREGSYGSDSMGNERPQGQAACFLQLILPCVAAR